MKPDEIWLGKVRDDGKYNGWAYYIGLMFIIMGWIFLGYVGFVHWMYETGYAVYFCSGSTILFVIAAIWLVAGMIGGVRYE